MAGNHVNTDYLSGGFFGQPYTLSGSGVTAKEKPVHWVPALVILRRVHPLFNGLHRLCARKSGDCICGPFGKAEQK